MWGIRKGNSRCKGPRWEWRGISETREEASGLEQMGQRGEWKEEREAEDGTGADPSGPRGCEEFPYHFEWDGSH